MAKKKDPEDILFDNLHDSARIKQLHKQAKKEQHLKRRKEWFEKHGNK